MLLSSHNRRYFYGCVATSQSTPKNCPLFLFTSNTLDITSCWFILLVPLLVLPDRPIWFASKTKCRSQIKQGWKIKHIQNHSEAPTTCKTRLGCCCDRTACHILPPLFFRLVADVANSRTNKPFLTYRLGARGPSSGPERFWHRLGMTLAGFHQHRFLAPTAISTAMFFLVGGRPTPLKNMSSSMGRMTSHI